MRKVVKPMHESDERRKDVRSDVNVCVSVDLLLAFSYEAVTMVDAKAAQWQWDELAVPPDLLRAMVDEKDLTMKDPLLVQMLTRVDWLLTSVLKTLGTDPKYKDIVPKFMKVNLSGSGLRFRSEQQFPVEGLLALNLILRPFLPIQAIGKVIRVKEVHRGDRTEYETAVEFHEIAAEDREAIIRHILRTQVTMQRQRQSQLDNLAIG